MLRIIWLSHPDEAVDSSRHVCQSLASLIPNAGVNPADWPACSGISLLREPLFKKTNKLEDVFVTAAARRAQEFQTTVEPLQCFLPSLGKSCSKKTGFVDHHVSHHVLATVGATFHQVQAGRATLDVQHSLINFLLLLFWSPGNFVAL